MKKKKASKDTIKKVKRQPTEWEKILANPISDHSLISRICKEINHNSTAERQTTQLKTGKGHE